MSKKVDIQHTDIDKNTLYTAMGVPEFWRFNGKVWHIYQLSGGKYVECDRSPIFPSIAKDELYQFLVTCQQDEVAAELDLRSRLREQS
ncbi:MAG: hypothetical protein AAF773_20285 [Cyanobacteria bacterium P01_D01_bin.115]